MARNHEEERHYPNRCRCGYVAKDQQDLNEHLTVMARADSDDR